MTETVRHQNIVQTYSFVDGVVEHVAKLALANNVLGLLDPEGGPTVLHFRRGQVFDLINCQVQLLNDLLKRDCKTGEPQYILDPYIDEILQLGDKLRLVILIDRGIFFRAKLVHSLFNRLITFFVG